MSVAIYPGSFDPVTLGHLNIIKRAAACFDSLIVCVMVNSKRRRAKVVVKGLRAVSDFEQEVQMAVINRHLNPKLETMFLASSEKYTYLSSTIVKEMARYGTDLTGLVPREIVDDVNRRMSEIERKED